MAERDFDAELVERLRFDDDEQANAPSVPPTAASPNGDRSEFERFVEGNVQAQRQDGFSAVEVKIERGDLTPEQFRGLATIMREFTGGYARSTVQQNLVLRWVRDEALYDVWQRLGELGLDEAGAARDHRRGQLPRHRQLQDWASPARWASTGRSRSGSRRWRSLTSRPARSTSR